MKKIMVIFWLLFDIYFLCELYTGIPNNYTIPNILFLIGSVCFMIISIVFRLKRNIDSTDFRKEMEYINSHVCVNGEFLKLLRHKNLEDLRLIESIVYTVVLICIFVSGVPLWVKFLLAILPFFDFIILVILDSINKRWLRKIDQ